jgi:small subunit ribosomal protein S2
MFSVGAHFAFSRSRRHPTVMPYIFGVKNKTEIFDLEKTSILLTDAKKYLQGLGTEGKMVLFVGGKEEVSGAVRDVALSLGMPYVSGRWIGGTLTNNFEIRKRIERLETLRAQKEKGELSKYTKKERVLIDREIKKLEMAFGGLLALRDATPFALVVVDPRHEHIAVSEAREKNIPVVAIANSDCDISLAAYPIVANDSLLDSVTFILSELAGAYREGRGTT